MVIPIAFSLNIDLSINKVFVIETKYLTYNDSFGTKWFSGEILNSGSIPYSVQARVDIFDGNDSVFTGWSTKRGLMPGSNFPFLIYWSPEKEGSYSARLRIYHGGEVKESFLNITAAKANAEDAFEIKEVRVFNNYIMVGISSKKDIEELVIIPSNYSQGWAFTEGVIKDVKKGITYYSVIEYEPSVWFPQTIQLSAVSRDGNYASSKSVYLERETGLSALIFNFILGLVR
ncbi:MAG: hypothetical protein NT120_01425 [Candidatus Aenigmarchaeota archaeon]|nr:hypothetical protein [Candidatus Aenigmarchaeota archaeon]